MGARAGSRIVGIQHRARQEGEALAGAGVCLFTARRLRGSTTSRCRAGSWIVSTQHRARQEGAALEELSLVVHS